MSKQDPLVCALTFLASLMLPALCHGQVITTVAGINNQGYAGDGGPATSASFSWTNSLFVGLAMDAAGNVYFPTAVMAGSAR